MLEATMNKVTVDGLKKFVKLSVDTGHALFVHGTFGIGKTEIVGGTLREMGYEPVDWFRASSMSPDTLAGVPYVVGEKLARAVPEIIDACRRVAAQGKRPALVMDEMNIATPSMLGAMLQLLREKQLAGFHLPDSTPVIGMGNLATDGSIVHELPLPAANRMMHVVFTGPTFEEWERWAGGAGVHPAVMNTLREQPHLLNERASLENPAEGIGRIVWGTPRTWAMLSDLLKVAEQKDYMTIAASVVGDACAVALETSLQGFFETVSLNEVLRSPETAPVPNVEHPGHCYMQMLRLLQELEAIRGVDTRRQAADKLTIYLKRMDRSWVAAALALAYRSLPKAAQALFDGQAVMELGLEEIGDVVMGLD